MKLHGYFRSSASYRVRIALNLKGLRADHLAHHLRKGEQCAPAYLAINPQGLVPTLEDDAGGVLTQSLAIIEWLDETHPEPPLLPKDPLRRAKVRAFAQVLGVDPALIETHGAVSEPVAEAMAAAALRRFGADTAVAITGVAGPDGGTADKPVGTVCFTVALADGESSTRTLRLPGNRADIRERSTTVAMHLLRRALSDDKD